MLVFSIISIIIIYIFIKKSNLNSKLGSFFKPEKTMSIDDIYNNKKVAEQKQLDKLLEKINKKGYKNLLPKEKERLNKLSKN